MVGSERFVGGGASRRAATMKLRIPSVLPSAAVGLAVAVLLAACANRPPILIEASVQSDPALTAQRPNDIVVLPVEDATSSRDVDVRALRAAVADALPEKAYVPIAIEYSDSVIANSGASVRGSVVEASSVSDLRGKVQEDAFLGVKVTEWDASRLATSGRLRFSAEVMMTSSQTGQPLWWGQVVGDVKAGGESDVTPVSRQDRLRSVRELFGRYLLRELPRRTP